jgi:hypothetical protein
MVRKDFHCPDCGSVEGYRSRPRNAAERYLLPLVFILPLRCAVCYRRSYVPASTRTAEGRIERLENRTAA